MTNAAPKGRTDGRIYWHPNVVDDLIDAEQVQPHEQNPNNGDEDEVRVSVLENGVYRHIYADRKTKRIIAGHTQYAVEIALQLEDGIERPVVPVSWAEGRNKAHVLKMMSVDNAAARKAKLDDALQLDLLRDLDGDLIGSGFDDDDMAALTAKLDAPFKPIDDEGDRLDELDAKPCPKCGYDVANDPEALRAQR